METLYKLVSSESHVLEPPWVFDGIPRALRDRAPLFATVDGGHVWVVEGSAPIPLAPTTARRGDWLRAEQAAGPVPVRWESVPPALYDSTERLRAQWTGRIDAEILYPTPALWEAIRQLPDAELQLALAMTYNDWLGEFCAKSPDRLVGLAKLPSGNVDHARDELLRCVDQLGLRGAILDAFPSGAPFGGSRADEPFWEVVDDLQVPISLHYEFGTNAETAAVDTRFRVLPPPMADALVPMIGSGLFERYPAIRIVLAHGDAGWAWNWMETLDERSSRYRHLAEYAGLSVDRYPSDYIRAHAWFTFHEDRTAVTHRDFLGDANLMWASYFPYEESHWPEDRSQAVHVTNEAPMEHRHSLMAGNAARLYRLPGYEEGITRNESTTDQVAHL